MNNYHVSKSPSPTPLPRFTGQNTVPVIAAPIPRRAAIIREPVLSYRSGLSQEYEVENYQSPGSQLLHGGPIREGQMATTTQIAQPNIVIDTTTHQRSQSMSHRISRQTEMNTSPVVPTPFYHNSVQIALGQPSYAPPPHVQTQQQQTQQQTQTQLRPVRPLPVALVDNVVRRLPPSPPSPPPLGNWPRLDSTAETTRAASRVKRKPLPQPSQLEPQPQQTQPTSSSNLNPNADYSSRRQEELPATTSTSGSVPPATGSQARHKARRSSRVAFKEEPLNSTSTSNPAPLSEARRQSHRSSRVLQELPPVSTSTTNPAPVQAPASEARHQPRHSSRMSQQELPPINTNTIADQAPTSNVRHQSESQMRRLPRPLPPPRPSPASYKLDPSELAAALQPFAETPVSPRTKNRPFGPRRKSNSIDDGRTPSADVSKMASFRATAFR